MSATTPTPQIDIPGINEAALREIEEAILGLMLQTSRYANDPKSSDKRDATAGAIRSVLNLHALALVAQHKQARTMLEEIVTFVDDNADASNPRVWDFASDVVSFVESKIDELKRAMS